MKSRTLSAIFFVMTFSVVWMEPVYGASTAGGVDLTSRTVLVAESGISFEGLVSGEKMDATKFDGANVQAHLDTTIKKIVGSVSLNTVDCGSLKNVDSARLCDDLRVLIRRFASGRNNDDATAVLMRMGDARNDLVLMSVSLRVKVGPGGSWDPNSGFITTTASTSHLQVSLIDVNDGKVLWKNEILYRKLPKLGKSKYKKAVLSLFSGFPGTKEK